MFYSNELLFHPLLQMDIKTIPIGNIQLQEKIDTKTAVPIQNADGTIAYIPTTLVINSNINNMAAQNQGNMPINNKNGVTIINIAPTNGDAIEIGHQAAVQKNVVIQGSNSLTGVNLATYVSIPLKEGTISQVKKIEEYAGNQKKFVKQENSTNEDILRAKLTILIKIGYTQLIRAFENSSLNDNFMEIFQASRSLAINDILKQNIGTINATTN
ncbi:hypothetical protein SS50377_23599 [Spironucleus salmonicida]|uniref:Uncharacterized protein n=1 Tax=Spironucleus salmonicida TaxID=348837 RepID=A0A9P8RY47_9EUKA|nr:hypothetical protein SS50377_23599 [Spironucleus salmonicida]